MYKQMTVLVGDYEVAVKGDYQPPERMTRDYPGCDASFDVDAFTATRDGVTVTDFADLGGEDFIAEIEEAVLEKIAGQEYEAQFDQREYDAFDRPITDAELSRWEPDTGPHY